MLRIVKAIIFDWVGTLFERFRTPYSFSEEVLRGLKQRYKLGLVTLAGQGRQQYLRCIRELGVAPAETGEPTARIKSVRDLPTV